jgi:hypothetical protein
MARAPRGARVLALTIAGVLLFLGLATVVFWDDLMRTALDPKAPYQTYKPPPAPDYRQRDAWYLMPTTPGAATVDQPKADVFFVGPTTYNGGPNWNAPIGAALAGETFRRVMAPNYAGPFVKVGRIFAPRYRQASLYTQLTLREDAREAREFAYGDVAQAFDFYLAHDNGGRPFVLVGVEQGGTLAARLLAEKIAPDEALRARLAAAYAPARQHQGAANATGLEWGARPAFLGRQVSAQCKGGVLLVSPPKSASLRRSGTWTDRRMAPGYNLFYLDIETDALARVSALTGR